MKQIIRKDIGEERVFNAEYTPFSKNSGYTPIEEVIIWLDEMLEKGATHIAWHATSDYDGMSESIEGQALRLEEESEKDYNLRMLAEQASRLAADDRRRIDELETYNKVNANYGDK